MAYPRGNLCSCVHNSTNEINCVCPRHNLLNTLEKFQSKRELSEKRLIPKLSDNLRFFSLKSK